jgi:hypothetical protein
MSLYQADWNEKLASTFIPLFHEVHAMYPDLFDYAATFDGLVDDPYVNVQVIPSAYLGPTVVVTEAGQETHIRLEATKPSKIPTPAEVAARAVAQRAIGQ